MASDDVDANQVEALLEQSLHKASEARVYDYYLGGASNFAVDREFAEQQLARYPDMRLIALENRRFLRRAVRYLLDQGVRQFVDIGSGIPTVGNVHQIAEQHAPGEAKVVYVDHDPIAEAHAKSLLSRDGDPNRHAMLRADLVDPGLWQQVCDTGLVDPAEPIGLLLVAVLHFITPDREPEKAVAHLRAQLAPGSYLTLSHATSEGLPPEQQVVAEEVRVNYEKQATNPGVFRGRDELTELFGGWPIVEPGIVWTCQWRREPEEPAFTGDPARSFVLAGVGHKPA